MGDGLGTIVTYIFILSVILVLAVYYVGVQTDVNVFSDAARSLIQTATGRTTQGTFAPYPK